MIICQTHNHNYPHQVDGEEACPKCEAETQRELAMDQEFSASNEPKDEEKSNQVTSRKKRSNSAKNASC